MSPQPKKNRFDETPQHAWPVVRPALRPAGRKPGLWQRIRGFFRLFSAMEGRLPPATPESSMPSLEPLQLSSSTRIDDFSFFEDDDEEIAKIAASNPGTLILFSSLDTVFDQRPLDVPFYTARKGRAFISLLFSEKNLPDAEILERVVEGSHPMTLRLTAVVDGMSPILRASLVFPDNLRNPLVLETLLHLADEDVQEFLQAAADSDELDLLLRHESRPGATIDLSVSAPRLPGLVQSQVAVLARDFHRTLSPAELGPSRQVSARVYRSSQLGSERDAGVKLRRVGRAKCLLREERPAAW